jgi:anti-sigma factor RsiW
MTTCPDFEALSALHDGEAPVGVREHVARCAACRETCARLTRLGDSLRALPEAQVTAPPSARRTSRSRRVRWLAPPAFAAAAMLALWLGTERGIPPALANEAVSQHLRSFANGHACDIESSDAGELDRYLSERLGRPIRIPASLRGSLVGARRCSLFGEHAGAVVYRENGVVVTVFLPTPGSVAARKSAEHVGGCANARDGQTVCVLPGTDAPRLAVGELPAAELSLLVAEN